MTKKVKIEKLEMGQSAYSTVAPDYLKKLFNDRETSWDSDDEFTRKEFVEVCDCLTDDMKCHNTIAKNGVCTFCDHATYTFQKSKKYHDEKGFKKFTQKQLEKRVIKRIQKPVEKVDLGLLKYTLSNTKLDLDETAELLSLSREDLDYEIKTQAKIKGNFFYSRIKMYHESKKALSKSSVRKEQAEFLGINVKAWERRLRLLKKTYTFFRYRRKKAGRKHDKKR